MSVTRFATKVHRLAAPMALAALLAVVAGCTSPISPVNGAPFSVVDLRDGTGDAVGDGLVLQVNYVGWLYNPSKPDNKGAAFDATGAAPYTFTLGSQTVIDGWNQGIRGMKVGGLRRIIVPPTLAYGSTRNGSIPPGATLVFEIELLSAVDPNATTPATTTSVR